MTTAATGHIHAGREIVPGGRYNRLLSFLRAHPGATTLEIIQGADVCAVSAIVSELRQMGYAIACELQDVSCTGSRRYRYTLEDAGQKELFQSNPSIKGDGQERSKTGLPEATGRGLEKQKP